MPVLISHKAKCDGSLVFHERIRIRVEIWLDDPSRYFAFRPHPVTQQKFEANEIEIVNVDRIMANLNSIGPVLPVDGKSRIRLCGSQLCLRSSISIGRHDPGFNLVRRKSLLIHMCCDVSHIKIMLLEFPDIKILRVVVDTAIKCNGRILQGTG